MRSSRFLSQLSFPAAMIVVTILITAMAGTAFAQRSSGVRVQISSSAPSALPSSSMGGDAVASPEADRAPYSRATPIPASKAPPRAAAS